MLSALICRFTYPNASIRDDDDIEREAIHRIYLEDDGHWHRGKKMLGSVDNGRVIILGTEDDTKTLGIGEGVESTAAGMQICRIAWGWAAASAGGLKKLAEWIERNGAWFKDHVKRVALFVDGGKVGVTAGNEVEAAATALGVAVEFVRSIGQDDLADDLFHDRIGHAQPFQLIGSQIAYPSESQVSAALTAVRFGNIGALNHALMMLARRAQGLSSDGKFPDAYVSRCLDQLKATSAASTGLKT